MEIHKCIHFAHQLKLSMTRTKSCSHQDNDIYKQFVTWKYHKFSCHLQLYSLFFSKDVPNSKMERH